VGAQIQVAGCGTNVFNELYVSNEFLDAAVRDQKRALELLKEHPELADARVLHGETCLHYLAVEGYADGVRFLATNGFDVNATNEFGDSPLVDAMRNSDGIPGCRVAALSLLEFHANPNAGSETGSPLYCAAERGDVELARALLVAGADPNLSDEVFGPPLHIAIKKKHREVIVLLLGHGADPNYSIALGGSTYTVLDDEDDEIRMLLTKHRWRG
jgi:ankyrin repeat protein